MSFSFLNVIYPFFILSLFDYLEEGLLEEFLVLHLVTGVAWGWVGKTTSLICILVMIFLLTKLYLLCGKFYGGRRSVATGPLTC